MAKPRWIVPWANSDEKPAIYHCVTRVVDKRFAFNARDKEQFRIYMRMYEKFSGCQILAYCLMCNHIHLLVEVPPPPPQGFSDDELLRRLGVIYNPAQIAIINKRLAEARQSDADLNRHFTALGEINPHPSKAAAVHAAYTYRMHDLSQFMKSLIQRFTQWYNKSHERSGNLWEDAFKSVVVEDGVAARTMAAYIDLNPLRAGMVTDPADYRWSSYGEAMGGGNGGNGKRARAGLARAMLAHKGTLTDAKLWTAEISRHYRMILLEAGKEKLRETAEANGDVTVEIVRRGIPKEAADHELAKLEAGEHIAIGKALCRRIRYFTDGAAIGSKDFVDSLFVNCRERFGPKRRNGARKLRGDLAEASAGQLWSIRDLRKDIS